MTRPLQLSTPHQADPECYSFHCWTHNVDELRILPYCACGECGHVFPTRRALRRDYRRGGARLYWRDLIKPLRVPKALRRQFGARQPAWFWDRWDSLRALTRLLTLSANDITFCPHCTHDL